MKEQQGELLKKKALLDRSLLVPELPETVDNYETEIEVMNRFSYFEPELDFEKVKVS